MTPLDVLHELLERVAASRDAAALVSEEEVTGWPADAVRELKSGKLLMKAGPATSVVCPGCDQECAMPVHTVPSPTGKAVCFVVCDKRNDVNRVKVPDALLKQWRCGAEAVAAFTAKSLGLRTESQRKAGPGLWELGLVTGKKRSQMLCLRADGTLELVAGNQTVLLAELVRYETRGYSLDEVAIGQMVDSATTGDSRYTPSIARREARKLDTQDLHESWRKAFRKLKGSRPGMSDVWYSQQIAKVDIAKGRCAETIRKYMKR